MEVNYPQGTHPPPDDPPNPYHAHSGPSYPRSAPHYSNSNSYFAPSDANHPSSYETGTAAYVNSAQFGELASQNVQAPSTQQSNVPIGRPEPPSSNMFAPATDKTGYSSSPGSSCRIRSDQPSVSQHQQMLPIGLHGLEVKHNDAKISISVH